MDSYLEITQEILRRVRRPLGPRKILEAAYQLGMVPSHLFGKTQHKTLQARVSEDILNFRDRSLFFRTEPGKFFLREFITDTSLPPEYRDPISTKRRARELAAETALVLKRSTLESHFKPFMKIPADVMIETIGKSSKSYENPKNENDNQVFIWAFVTVRRDLSVLSYRSGRYRENRESFLYKRTIGFSTLVDQNQMTLFNSDNFGIIDSGLSAMKIDLDIPTIPDDDRKFDHADISYFMWLPDSNGKSQVIAVIDYACPEWFEPIRRRLAINDVAWFDVNTRINNIEDFDPWSQAVLGVNEWGGVRALHQSAP